MRATRGDRARADLGEYYRVDVRRNAVVDTHVDLADLGRKLGALRPHEQLVAEER